MKVIMEFSLPEERDEYHMANRGGDYYMCLFDIYTMLRSYYKYDDTVDEKTIDTLWDRFWDILGEHNISMDEVQ